MFIYTYMNIEVILMRSFCLKPEIVYGENALDKIDSMNLKNVFITTDKVMEKIGLVSMLTKKLDENNINYTVFSDVLPDPNTDIVEKGLLEFIKFKPDSIIALGGGSVIDTAKAFIYYCIKIKENFMTSEFVHKPVFIAIPTTSGTGSEVTEYAVITDSKTHIKIPLTDSIMLPDVAILDPNFTKSVPNFVTAETGLDALTHAIEAYTAKGSNPFTDSLALEAIKLIYANLIPCYTDGTNLKYRENMHLASCMAGIAFNNAGLGIVHSLAHALGGQFGISHGKSNSMVLPFVIKFNSKDANTTKRYSFIAKMLNMDFGDDAKNAYALIESIKVLKNQLNIPAKLSDLPNVTSEDFNMKLSTIAENATKDVCTSANPISVSADDLKQILLEMF